MHKVYTDLIDEEISAANEYGKMVGSATSKGKYGLTKYEFFVDDEAMSQRLNKSPGRYVTVNCSKIIAHMSSVQNYVAKELSKTILSFINQNTDKTKPLIMVVGLGNAYLVADSLGVLTVRGLLVTHSLPEFINEPLGKLCALIPGVAGSNGISTYDIVAGVVSRVKPDVVFVVDTLTARDPGRIGCSFQFSDAGITPGAGIGNRNRSLNSKSLKVPTIAVGVPMMITAGALCSEISEDIAELVVTPKEVDIYAQKCAHTLSAAFNLAVHGTDYKAYC